MDDISSNTKTRKRSSIPSEPISITGPFHTERKKRQLLSDMMPEERYAYERERNRQACRRRDARKKAAKLGIDGPQKINSPISDEQEKRDRHNESERRRRRQMTPCERDVYIEKERTRNAARADQIKQNSARYYADNKAKAIAQVSEWAKSNPEKVEEYRKTSLAKKRNLKFDDPEKHKRLAERRRVSETSRRKSDVEYRLKQNLGSALRQSLRLHGDGRKTQKIKQLIGCTIQEFVAHIERQFTKKMTWEKYGPRGWHIDHIRPCASFDLTDPEEQRACFHFTNMRPLDARENQQKSAKLELLL